MNRGDGYIIKYIIIIYISALILVLGATSEPLMHEVGPFNVSVDVGRDVSWKLLDPIELELGGYNITSYTLNGFVNDAPKTEDHVAISIAKFDQLDPVTLSALSTTENITVGLKNSIAIIGAKPISISPRVFDGHQGMIGVAYWDMVKETLFLGQWYTEDALVSVTSNIRWGEGTQQIFDTIHIK